MVREWRAKSPTIPGQDDFAEILALGGELHGGVGFLAEHFGQIKQSVELVGACGE